MSTREMSSGMEFDRPSVKGNSKKFDMGIIKD